MSILVVLPTHAGDVHLAAELLGWIAELGPLRNTTVVLAHDRSIQGDALRHLERLAQNAFGEVELLKCNVDSFPRERENAWRAAANAQFKCVCNHMAERMDKQGWLNLEPDCVPMHTRWLKEIDEEYALSDQPFMGPIVQVPRAGHMLTHTAGVCVYPANAREFLGSALDGSEPWDTKSAKRVLPLTHNTQLIRHRYHKPGTEFVDMKVNGSPDRVQVIESVPKSCALYHRCKDGSAIAILRKRLHIELSKRA